MLQAKKMLIMNILDILKKYSDENHKLTQQDIIKLLYEKYDMEAERKAVKRNIDNLIEEGYDINYSEVNRGKGKDKNTLTTDYYMIRDFEDAELRLLIDSVLFAKNIPYSQGKTLIKKLESLSNVYFKSRVKHIELLEEKETTNPNLFLNIEVIDEAISKNRKISFKYCSFNKDKKLVARKDPTSKKDKLYKATPYQMVASNGRYYLVCSFDSHDDSISNIRVDKIKDIEMLEERGIQKDATKRQLDNLVKTLKENMYMFTGESEYVEFKFDKTRINEVIDWFGTHINIHEEKNDKNNYYVSLKANLRTMKLCALQYGDCITILSPESLVKEVKEEIKNMQKRYNIK